MIRGICRTQKAKERIECIKDENAGLKETEPKQMADIFNKVWHLSYIINNHYLWVFDDTWNLNYAAKQSAYRIRWMKTH